MKHRPWGSIDWALSLSGRKDWYFAGVIGTEERSLASWLFLKRQSLLTGEKFAQIIDVDSEKYRTRNQLALQLRLEEYLREGGNQSNVERIELMAELFIISRLSQLIEQSGSSIILDITSFPKRFFFPILRTLFLSNSVKNLMITYTAPATYPDGEPLYEEIEPWRNLPGFGGTGLQDKELWIVSVGFLVESLRLYVDGNPNEKMKILIPFPASLAVLRRTWEAVANLESNHSAGRFEKFRVETLDISAAFDRISSLAGTPEKRLAFAPFGPKTTSAAMCLYAIQRGSSVYYPQPTVYHPEYSKGIRDNDPLVAIRAYWIKHEGENLYSV